MCPKPCFFRPCLLSFLLQVADEHGLEFEGELVDVGGQPVKKKEKEVKVDDDDLEERLRKLQSL